MFTYYQWHLIHMNQILWFFTICGAMLLLTSRNVQDEDIIVYSLDVSSKNDHISYVSPSLGFNDDKIKV